MNPYGPSSDHRFPHCFDATLAGSMQLSSRVVSSGPRDWKRFERPGFVLEFSYPQMTPEGHAVEELEEHVQDHRGDIERVHLSSPESGELYFEVARFRDLAPTDDYLSHANYLAQRFGPDSVSPLTETTVEGRRAWTYSIEWPDHERSVLMLYLAGDTYRFIYDPRSELNHRVLATLTVEE